MGKRSRGESDEPDHNESYTSEMEVYLASVLTEAGFELQFDNKIAGHDVRIVVRRSDLGKGRCYAIEVHDSDVPTADADVARAIYILNSSEELNEYWIVGDSHSETAGIFAARYPRLRLFTAEEVKRFVSERGKRGARRAQTNIGTAMLANNAEIRIISAAIITLIDERLELLRKDLPNSREAKAERDKAIEDYDNLKREVRAFDNAAEKFQNGAINEEEAVKASEAFKDGIKEWWAKSNERICERAFDMGMFATAVSICSLAGSGGQMAIAVSLAMIGGKHLTDAIKQLKDIWK